MLNRAAHRRNLTDEFSLLSPYSPDEVPARLNQLVEKRLYPAYSGLMARQHFMLIVSRFSASHTTGPTYFQLETVCNAVRSSKIKVGIIGRVTQVKNGSRVEAAFEDEKPSKFFFPLAMGLCILAIILYALLDRSKDSDRTQPTIMIFSVLMVLLGIAILRVINLDERAIRAAAVKELTTLIHQTLDVQTTHTFSSEPAGTPDWLSSLNQSEDT